MNKKTLVSSHPVFKGLILFFGSILLFLTLIPLKDHNILGLFGLVLSTSLRFLFGLNSLLISPFLLWISIQFLQKKEVSWKKKSILFFFFLSSLSLFFILLASQFPKFAELFKDWVHVGYFPKSASFDPLKIRYYLGGVPLHFLYSDIPWINLKQLLGVVGTFFVALTTFFISGFFLFDGHISIFKKLFLYLIEKCKTKQKPAPKVVEEPLDESLFRTHPMVTQKIAAPIKKEMAVEEVLPPPKKLQLSDYTFPNSNLLTQVKKKDLSFLKNDLKRQADVLEETLLSFGIEAKVGDIHSGPTITSFEVHPAVGVKVQKIKTLENDIALNMQAKAIRIIAPIPGKAAVGIELPNLHPQEVSFREGIESYQNGQKKCRIPLILGKAVNGEDIVADLTKTPHMLVAGATGSGKSVCINTLVMSIIMNCHPDEVKFVMVDPKKVELSAYSPLPHMLAPVITEADEARSALLYLVKEMEKRYELFRKLSHRNIESFNNRKPAAIEAEMEEEVPKHLPYIVLIIDEFADLMMVSTSDMETPIARIAQMARAVGIHMVLATQRPSREVITGLIKANFPSRIAFKVASRVNSQIILDDCGAESLLGNGDMLFLPPGSSTLIRAQGSYIRDEDIHGVIDFVKNQAPANYLINSFRDFGQESMGMGEETSSDSLYSEAKNLVLETGNASTTFLQRKLKIGYARAASLMDELEKNRIIGPQEGAKPRKVFYPEEGL